MNVLIVNINIGKPRGWGGIESHSDTLASTLFRKGHNVIMACWKEGAVEIEAGKLVLPSRRITIRNSGDLAAVIKMIKVFLKEHIHVIIANAGREYWPAAVAAKIAGTKVIFIRHQVDRLKKTTCWLVNKHVDRVIAVSNAVRDALIESGVSGIKIDVIHNSIDTERFDPGKIDRAGVRRELGIYGADIVVGTAGKLDRGKGVYEILSATCLLTDKYPSIKLLFVGDGPERADLEREAGSSLMKGKVIFAGMRRDIERMYAAMDIFALPSYDEGLPTVLVEAMAMGRSVIATPVGGIPEIVEDGVNGILIPPKNAGAIAEAICRYLYDDGFREKVALEGRNTVQRDFSDKVMGDRFDKVLNEVYNNKNF